MQSTDKSSFGTKTSNKKLNAKLIKSSNPILFLEFDRKDPNINNAGFRGANFPAHKTLGITRIAILGDSVAYGFSVPLEETFARLIEKQLNTDNHPIEVLNFAVNGYSTVSELELYKTRIREYQPDIVLLAYVLNDPIPTSLSVKVVGKTQQKTSALTKLWGISKLGVFIFTQWQKATQKIFQKNNYRNTYANADLWNATSQSLAELSTLTKQDGAKFGVVVFPLLLDFNNYPMRDIHKQVDDTLQVDGIPHIDLLDNFSTTPYMDLRPDPNDDTHPNALGHAIAAKRITQFIEEKLLPAKQ